MRQKNCNLEIKLKFGPSNRFVYKILKGDGHRIEEGRISFYGFLIYVHNYETGGHNNEMILFSYTDGCKQLLIFVKHICDRICEKGSSTRLAPNMPA